MNKSGIYYSFPPTAMSPNLRKLDDGLNNDILVVITLTQKEILSIR